MKRFLLIIGIITLSSITLLKGMDVRTLDIGYEKVSQLTYRAKVTAYVFNSGPYDSTMTVAWGDNDTTQITMDNITVVNNYLRKIDYSGVHTYSGVSNYTISVEYYNRAAGVKNMNNSANQTIFIRSQVIINPFLGNNSSPEFTMPPIDNACQNQAYIYDPGIIDPENDSLVISSVKCRGNNGQIISSYSYPNASAAYTVDAASGMIVWDAPVETGRYNVAIRVDEYRNGQKIGSSMRDMQINVSKCNNQAPDLFVFNDTCVEVGDLLNVPAYTLDTTGDTLRLQALGEIMNLPTNPGQFNNPTTGIDSAGDYLTWTPGCDLVRKKPYEITFIAEKRKPQANGYFPYTNTFNNGALGIDWQATSQLTFTNPCPPSADGTTYLWMGNAEQHPRHVVTQAFDLTGGSNELHFDMKWSEQGAMSPCEGPDLPDEGVHLQYSINGPNGPWKEIIYWDPSKPPPGGVNPMLTVWNHYSIPIPNAAISSNTRFRFSQIASSGMHYDHWGIDNFELFDRPENLSRAKTVEVKVIAPAPENLTATAVNQNIELEWDKSKCPNASGYKIYRKNNYLGYIPNTCETGVPAYTGYKEIATVNGINDTTFLDDNNGQGMPQGFKYCYMVTAVFPDGAESYPSLEACATVKRDKPLLTKVSVSNTDPSNGVIDLEWTQPDFIKSNYTGPYRYLIYRAENSPSNWTLIDSTASITDTTYTDNGLNTGGSQYYYKIHFYQVAPASRTNISRSPHSSSVFLDLTSGDEKITVNMNYDVSWNNDSFIIFRKDPGSSTFDSITIVTKKTYLDTGLVNNKEYCYKVRSIGSYSANGLPSPLYNMSQETCAQPKDNEAPCAPNLTVTVNCFKVSNKLRWNNPNNSCADDVSSYNIYHRPSTQGSYGQIASNDSPTDTTYVHQKSNTIAGCYYVTAIDSSGNESTPSNEVCVSIDSCDIYRLPNVFTPNGDGKNDLLKPFPYDFVESIQMKIFNRWGNIVYETTDPDINWDGRHQDTNENCAEGVYYYVCEVYQRTLEGQKKITLSGDISLLR